jgi:tRNA(Ile)-lysidine synthase
MENLVFSFQETLFRLGAAKKNRLLLAVSGGLDSVVLTACCAMADLDFGIAHANFQLREAESDRDEEFVRHLAGKYHKPFFTKRFDTAIFAKYEKLSVQEAARNLRYEWFETLIGNKRELFQFLVTAHHLDDNIETMLMHLFRGTGIAGLTGMPEKNKYLIRPLLSVPKSRLTEFAVSQNLKWVEDSSNASDDYTRNYFRNQLIPSVSTVFPDCQVNLGKNLQRFSEAFILYKQAIDTNKKKLLRPIGSEIHIPILLLKKTVPLHTIFFEILREFQFSPAQTDDAIRLMDSANGKFIISSSHRIIKNRRWLIIAPLENASPAHLIIEENQSTVIYPEGKLQLRKLNIHEDTAFVSKEPGIACLDAGKIRFPLILRKWKTGDYFYPLGMKKKKKLARFFIDRKLSKTAKEKVWVLVMDSHIIWVIGQRIDNRFCTSVTTNKILLIKSEDASTHS